MAGPLGENEFAALLKAVRSGDWETTRALLKLDPAALKRRTCTIMGGTVLHAAVDAEQELIVEKLVDMISEPDSLKEMRDNFCFTALHQATTSGNCRIAMCLIKKYEGLVSVRNIDRELPVTMAMGFGHKKLARELYHLTPPGDLEAEEGWQGAALLKSSIYARDLGIHISLDRAANQFRSSRFRYGEEDIRPVRADMWRHLLKFLGTRISLGRDAIQFHCDNRFDYRSVRAIWRHLLKFLGMLPKYSAIDHIRGAALQMQREVQWFKEVESICPPSCKDHLNNNGLTAIQLFTTEHQELRKDGEKWMKGTATSCTVVSTLIMTIMFAAAFTIPGGNNQDTGLPIFMHDKLFNAL
ncbi:uncharacterized protein LOC122293495 [Carya illinoinensis]|uniref:uncharacterized protein LOC122293495 n=1 Tax=Carya illinoinensis TaxID=32201 RepID=UPI001C71F39B|nr:uncharacterized protein LOC122293495 [Carya illinoinensis]